MKNLILLVLILSISNPAFALLRGNAIYPVCEHIHDRANPENYKTQDDIIHGSMDRGFLIGFCTGVVGTSFQAIRGIGYTWSVDGKFTRCMEDYYGFENIGVDQILDMTMKFLKEHPEYRNAEINTIMALMLHHYYPSSVCGANIPLDGVLKDKKHYNQI